MKRILIIATILSAAVAAASAETVERFKFGDMNSWVTRNITESKLIGGQHRTLYAIGPTLTIDGNKAYTTTGGSPWGTSNVYAKVCGIVKGSNTVEPDTRSGADKCAKLMTLMQHCKAVGIVDIDVVAAGSIFTGYLIEPITSTHSPYSKINMGVEFNRRPDYLQFDYKLSVPQGKGRVYSSGFGKKKEYAGTDNAEVFILLQRRWEDADGNIHARRVGTGRERFAKSTSGWVNRHRIPVLYGDITSRPEYKSWMGLIPKANSYYALNSHGKMVPVVEEGWDSADATPTHIIVMASSGCGTAYIGTLDMTLWIDNIAVVYK